MQFLPKLITRLNITIFLLLIQIVLVIIFLFQFIYLLPIISVASYIISFLILLFLVKKDIESDYKTIWVIAIMGLPILGGVFYLMFRNNHLSSKITNKIFAEHELITAELEKKRRASTRELIDSPRRESFFDYIENDSSYVVYRNVDCRYFSFGQEMFADMLNEIEKAEKYIFLEYFILSESQMLELLIEKLSQKAAQGVDVRLIYDDIGSHKLFTNSFVALLKDKGIKTVRFNPFVPFISVIMNHRDHRKILVIDGKIAFNGGMNIGDEYINRKKRFGVWKDTGVRLKGEAVTSFTMMFIESWNSFCKKDERITGLADFSSAPLLEERAGLVVPYGDTPLDNEPLSENIYIDILNQAKDYVYIFTPYLIISEKMTYALKMAAKRGVDVRIATPGIPDKRMVYRLTRSYYRYLLPSGIKIYEYTPGFLHAKNFLSDDKIAVVGTINMDFRSLHLHFECATLMYKTSTIADIKQDMLETFEVSKQVSQAKKKREFWHELVDAILHLFAPML